MQKARLGLLVLLLAAASVAAQETAAQSGPRWKLTGLLGAPASLRRDGKDVETNAVPAYVGHTSTVAALALAPSAGQLAAAGEDRRVIVWDLARRKVIHTLQCDSLKTGIARLAVSPDGRTIAARSPSQIAVHDAETGRLLWQQGRDEAGDGKRCDGIAFTANDRILLPGLGELEVREARTGRELAKYPVEVDGSRVNPLLTRGPLVAFFEDGDLHFMDAGSGKCLGRIADSWHSEGVVLLPPEKPLRDG